MRGIVPSIRARTLCGIALLTVLSSVTAGCSGDMSRFTSGSIFDIGTKPKKQVAKVDDVAITGSLPSAPVSSGMLPPPSSTPMAAAAPAAATALNTAAGSAASYAGSAVEAGAAPVANAAVQYKNWSSAGGTLVTVAPGETTATIGRRYGIPEEAILATNRLSSAAQVQPGSQIIIPTYVYGQPAKGVAAATAPTLASAPTPTLTAPAMPAGTLGTMPASAATAATTAAAVPAKAAAQAKAAGTSYVVKSGDSLRGLAKRNGLSYKELAAANGLDPNTELKIGQKVMIPGAAAASAAAAAPAMAMTGPGAPPARLGVPQAKAVPPAHALQAPATASMTVPEPASPAPVAAVKTAPVAAQKTAPTQVAALPAQMSDAGSAVQSAAKAAAAPDPEEEEVGTPKSGFRWPARGRVISGFGKKSNGESNDGINLAVPEGTPVKAAEEGVVVYSGNELQGYGNLVLVRHPNGWVTAYAHNSELLVSKGETVKRGQVISKAGASGNVTSPQLHFELRKGSRPVDPTPYLGGV